MGQKEKIEGLRSRVKDMELEMSSQQNASPHRQEVELSLSHTPNTRTHTHTHTLTHTHTHTFLSLSHTHTVAQDVRGDGAAASFPRDAQQSSQVEQGARSSICSFCPDIALFIRPFHERGVRCWALGGKDDAFGSGSAVGRNP